MALKTKPIPMSDPERINAIKDVLEALGDPEFWSQDVLDGAINQIDDITVASSHWVDDDPGDPEVGPMPSMRVCICEDGEHGYNEPW